MTAKIAGLSPQKPWNLTKPTDKGGAYRALRLTRLAVAWRGTATTVEVPDLRLGANQGCAILVQSDSQGPNLGAAACPAPAA